MGKEVLIVLLLLLVPIALAQNANTTNNNHYLITDSKNLRVVEIDGKGNLVWEYKCAGSQCFCDKDTCFFGFDSATRLDNGDTLLIDNLHNKILEVDIDGNSIWRYGDGKIGSYFNQLNHPRTAFRLPNGNTLIADSGNNRIIEVEKGKSTQWEYGCDNKFLDCNANVINENLKDPASATMTDAGTVLIADMNNDRVIEVSKNNEIVWGFGCTAYDLANKCEPSVNNLLKPTFAIRLLNSTLISDGGGNRVIEVSKSGEIIWQYGTGKGRGFDQLNLPKSAIMLENGNILISDYGNDRIIEVDKKTKEVVFEYSALSGPTFAQVPKINYARIRHEAPGCIQRNNGFQVEFRTTVQPKYSYAMKKGSDQKIYLLGKYSDGLFTSNDDKITESGQYTFYASYDEELVNYSMYCKLDKIICNAIDLSINSCVLDDGVLNVSFSGIGEQYRFINFNNMFVDIKAEEKVWEEINSRKCGEKPRLDLQRFGIGSRVGKSGNDSFNLIAPIGKYNVRMVNLMLGECCQEDLTGSMIYPKTKTLSMCSAITRCGDDAECDDGNDITADICEAGACVHDRINLTCISDKDCQDYNQCTVDSCVLGKCDYASGCADCSYCSIDKSGCITNESCILLLEQNSKKEQVIADAGEKSIDEDISGSGVVWLVIGLVLFSIFSSTAVFLFMKRKLDLEIEKERKLEADKKDVKDKNPAVVRNLTPEQEKGLQEIVGRSFGSEKNTDAADNPESLKRNAYVKQTVDPAKVAAAEAAKDEPAQTHVRQAFPGTQLPGNAVPNQAPNQTAESAPSSSSSAEPAIASADHSASDGQTGLNGKKVDENLK